MEIVPVQDKSCETCKYQSRCKTDEPCVHCTKNATDEYKIMTNGDYIRSLSDADLAQIVMCPNEIGFDEVVCQRDEQHCIECTRRWLEAEREVE
nr:MAG TPA: hypothetical protein [Caudoviricetes sp.]